MRPRCWLSCWRRTVPIRVAGNIWKISSGPARPSDRSAPTVDKIRVFYNHPGFVAANADHLRAALAEIPADRREPSHVAFTAHSIPLSMARSCRYAEQLKETCRLVCERLAIPDSRYGLVYQSRSGRPGDPWLEPDILDHLAALHSAEFATSSCCRSDFSPIISRSSTTWTSKHGEKAPELGLNMVRAATVGTHPAFVAMLADLIQERLTDTPDRPAIGRFGPSPDVCPADCCPARRRGRNGQAQVKASDAGTFCRRLINR